MIRTILESAHRQLRHTASAAARSHRVSVMLRYVAGRRLRRTAAVRQHADRLSTRWPMAPVARIDDPDGSMALVVVRRTIDETTNDVLRASVIDLTAGQFLHLDLTDASIDTLPALRSLEQLLNHLENRGVGLRVVGLDPAHPLLAVSTA